MGFLEKLNEYKDDLDLFEDDLQKYEFIIDLGKKIDNFPQDQMNEANLVAGCTSQVWLVCEKKDEKFYFKGQSDALIVKGLVYMICDIFSDLNQDEIKNANLEKINDLGLIEIITPTRQNGLSGMIKKIKGYANE